MRMLILTSAHQAGYARGDDHRLKRNRNSNSHSLDASNCCGNHIMMKAVQQPCRAHTRVCYESVLSEVLAQEFYYLALPTSSRLRQDAAKIQSVRFATSPLLNLDRKSTRLNSSHVAISYAIFCLKQ